MLHVRGGPSDGIHRPRIYGLLFSGAMVITTDLAAVRTGIDDLRIVGVRSDVSALAAADRVPLRAIDAAVRAGCGDGDGGVVLLCAVDGVGETVVRNNVV